MKRLKRLKQLVNPEPQAGTSRQPRMMRCHTSTATNNPHPLGVRAGQRLPEDHPLVKRWPWAFLPDELGDDAGQAAAEKLARETEEAGHEVMLDTEHRDHSWREKREEAVRNAVIPIERQMLAVRHAGALGSSVPMVNWKDGEPRGIRPGEIADTKWRLVRDYPDCFVRVLPEGLKVEDALTCIADEAIRQIAPDGSVARKVRRGQMVHKGDPLVEIHPTMFVSPGYAGSLAGSQELTIVARGDQVVSDTRGTGYVKAG